MLYSNSDISIDDRTCGEAEEERRLEQKERPWTQEDEEMLEKESESYYDSADFREEIRLDHLY